MGHRRDSFDAGIDFIYFMNGNSRKKHSVFQFFKYWELPFSDKNEDLHNYNLNYWFGQLPKSQEQIQTWFNLGIQYAQSIQQIKDLPSWEALPPEEISNDHMKWAIFHQKFIEAIEEAGLSTFQINEADEQFKKCNGKNFDIEIHHLRNKLRYWAQDLDNRYRIPENIKGTKSELQVPEESLSFRIKFSNEKSKNVRSLIVTGRLEEALKELNNGELDPEQKAIATIFSFRFATLKKEESMGMMTSEEASVAMNRLARNILMYVML